MLNLFNGDYIDKITEIKDDIRVVITDPPYIHEKGGRGKLLLGDSLDRDKFNMKKLGSFGREQIYDFLDNTRKLMSKPQWYIFCSEKQLVHYLDWCMEKNMKYNLLVWCKPLSVMNRERYSTNIEYIVRIYSGGCALNKIDLGVHKDKTKFYSKWKSFTQVRRNKLHPSQKPTELLNELIELSTVDGDIVLDPFMGSGSTGESCLTLGRRFIGIELEEEYFNKANARLNVYNTY